jgi:hypothetical protein
MVSLVLDMSFVRNSEVRLRDPRERRVKIRSHSDGRGGGPEA